MDALGFDFSLSEPRELRVGGRWGPFVPPTIQASGGARPALGFARAHALVLPRSVDRRVFGVPLAPASLVAMEGVLLLLWGLRPLSARWSRSRPFLAARFSQDPLGRTTLLFLLIHFSRGLHVGLVD